MNKKVYSAYANNINCDVYIGQSSGKKLCDDISNCKKSIKIISPYLDTHSLKKLIDLSKKGIKVELITMDNIENNNEERNKEALKMLLKQEKIENKEKVNERDKRKKLNRIFKYIQIFLISMIFFLLAKKISKPQYLMAILTFMLLGIQLFILNNLRVIKRMVIYEYSYHCINNFKIKFFNSFYKNPTKNFNREYDNSFLFIHSKIYLIDNEILYTGSMNFTNQGFNLNFESRVRTENEKIIESVSDMIKKLFEDKSYKSFFIDQEKTKLYLEVANDEGNDSHRKIDRATVQAGLLFSVLVIQVVYLLCFINPLSKEKVNKEKNITVKEKSTIDKKEIFLENKLKKKGRLIYKIDDVYTKLSWKGYSGSGSLEKFKKERGIKSKGIDEEVLKALDIEIKYE